MASFFPLLFLGGLDQLLDPGASFGASPPFHFCKGSWNHHGVRVPCDWTIHFTLSVPPFGSSALAALRSLEVEERREGIKVGHWRFCWAARLNSRLTLAAPNGGRVLSLADAARQPQVCSGSTFVSFTSVLFATQRDARLRCLLASGSLDKSYAPVSSCAASSGSE